MYKIQTAYVHFFDTPNPQKFTQKPAAFGDSSISYLFLRCPPVATWHVAKIITSQHSRNFPAQIFLSARPRLPEIFLNFYPT